MVRCDGTGLFSARALCQCDSQFSLNGMQWLDWVNWGDTVILVSDPDFCFLVSFSYLCFAHWQLFSLSPALSGNMKCRMGLDLFNARFLQEIFNNESSFTMSA